MGPRKLRSYTNVCQCATSCHTRGAVECLSRQTRPRKRTGGERWRQGELEEASLCGGTDEHEKWNVKARGESPLTRADRVYAEILQEVRVAQTAVQILLGFLLTLAFMPRFSTTSRLERDIYVVTLLLGAAGMALLIAPTAVHRVMYRRRLKRHLVRVAHRFALAGLAVLVMTMGSGMLLILDVVAGMYPAIVLTGGVVAWFTIWWFAFPTWMRVHHKGCGSTDDLTEKS